MQRYLWVVHSPHQMQGFYAFSNSTGADTVTVNFTGSGGTYVGMACGEWSGPTHLDVHGESHRNQRHTHQCLDHSCGQWRTVDRICG